MVRISVRDMFRVSRIKIFINPPFIFLNRQPFLISPTTETRELSAPRVTLPTHTQLTLPNTPPQNDIPNPLPHSLRHPQHLAPLPSHPAPAAGVFLHCGDLTQVGGLPAYQQAISDIASVDAELKLVIAGNHDLDLDEEWVCANAEDADDLKQSQACISFMDAQKGNGIHCLTEGLHAFSLRDGRTFTVYASPYTPAFNGYVFAYGKEDMRFTNIPSGVDILMTHGPPLFPFGASYTLDVNKDAFHCGCEKLAAAVQLSRPRLHCFGHIHEGRGAVRMNWWSGTMKGVADDGGVLRVRSEEKGRESVLVNAAVYGQGKGWVVEVEGGLDTVMSELHL
jgi:hypothetical protein